MHSCKGDRIQAPSPLWHKHFPVDTPLQDVRGGGTTRPDGGHLVLGLDVWGDSWSSDNITSLLSVVRVDC